MGGSKGQKQCAGIPLRKVSVNLFSSCLFSNRVVCVALRLLAHQIGHF